jgi:hypothetical protein
MKPQTDGRPEVPPEVLPTCTSPLPEHYDSGKCVALERLLVRLETYASFAREDIENAKKDGGSESFRVKEVRRMFLVEMVRSWEGFVREIIRETYVALLFSSNKSLEELSSHWPGCERVLDEISKTEAGRKSLIALALNKVSLHEFLAPHVEKAISDYCGPLVWSVEGKGGKCVTKALRFLLFGTAKEGDAPQLQFQEKKRSTPQLRVFHRVGTVPHDMQTITFASVRSAHNAIRFMYGMRCIYSHDDPQETFERALSGFDELMETDAIGASFLREGDDRAEVLENPQSGPHLMAKSISKVYANLRQLKHQAWVAPRSTILGGQILELAARRLVQCLSDYFAETCKAEVWTQSDELK